MNKPIDELTERINKLYKTYEKFITNKSDRHLAIIFDNNILTFYLYEKEELIDEFHLSFDEKEKDLYKATCLRTFIMALGNVLVHKQKTDDYNTYYNNHHKPYQAVIAKDKNVDKLIEEMLENQETEIINNDTKVVKDLTDSLKTKRYKRKFWDALDQRIKISREMLKWR